ncbi:DUF3488 and transglutaminase-like domain-containing protein [Arthrobacter sp. CJ23]|uniref:transglutaminase family protein n=1 Tax=Arthrobacter sp. CJ23 TaxID=2972479 RepID=UPI00215C8D1D|nr:DUF3488 and transglutaminase-like domain-containing protein [Arthrobacter sp. CJ23]UVJ40714.1 DUF3488 and transglutaminase-like domain-containing protein [Arthrobacter sp. CJ23]
MTTTSRQGSPGAGSSDPRASGSSQAGNTPSGSSPSGFSPLRPAARRPGPGIYPWAMSGAIAAAVIGAAISLNGVLRGWAWLLPVITVVCTVALTLAVLRSLRAQSLLAMLGGLVSLVVILTFIFLRRHSLAGIIPTPDTLAEAGRLLKRAAETVLSESAPVAPNAGIVLVTCASLGVLVLLIDALAVPLDLPASSGLGLLAVLVVPATIKPQSVGVAGFLATAAGYLLILACSQWFAPDARLQSATGRGAGQFKRSALTGALALVLSLAVPLAIPGFESGTFPQGSRLNSWGTSNGLNPMITLGNSLRSPSGSGRITYASSATGPLYLRSVTIDHFDGETWGPDDRAGSRQAGVGQIQPDYRLDSEPGNSLTVIDAGLFTSPYLPAPYAPTSVNGLNGLWTWDPETLSIMSTSATTRGQQYTVLSAAPRLSAAALAQATGAPQSISEEFLRVPGDVPDLVRQTAGSITAAGNSSFAKALAIQKYLRSGAFSYSLQAPVQNGYDGNGLSVLADFLTQKSGYCVHFSSAMAVMARLQGIPSRIAVGYAPGRPTGETVALGGEGTFAEFEVDARDAHAWPELYFEGLGWVPFEPTPSRGSVPDYALDAQLPGGASTNDDEQGALQSAPNPQPSSSTAPEAQGVGPGTGSGSQLLLLGLLTAGALLLAALLVSPGLVRLGIRRRRLRPRPARPGRSAGGTGPARYALPELAWDELQDLAADFGVPAARSETPRHFSARLRGSSVLGEAGGIDDAGHRAVVSLTGDFERQRYGRPGGAAGAAATEAQAAGGPGGDAAGAPAAERIGAVRESFRGNSPWWVRVRADWLPPSLMHRWSRILGSPFRGTARIARRSGRALRSLWRRLRSLLPGRR